MSQTGSVIDTDIHNVVSSRAILERLPEPHRTRYASGGRGAGHLGYWNPNGVMRADTRRPDGSKIEASPEALAEHFFDVYDLAYGIFNAGGMNVGLSPDVDFASALLAAENRAIAEEWLPVDPRFRASILINPNDPDRAVEEIDRWSDHPGFVQVLMPSGARMGYGQRYFHPIYAAAERHGLPVAIHPGSEGVGLSGQASAAGFPSSYLEWHTGLVGNYIAHLLSLVTEGVFCKFPGLKFVFLEGGVSWLPPLLWRFDKNWKALRISSPWLEQPPSQYVFDHCYLSTQPIEEPDDIRHLHQVLAMFPAERMLLFATDYPHWDGDVPDFTSRLLPERLRARVLRETAAELYGLELSDG